MSLSRRGFLAASGAAAAAASTTLLNPAAHAANRAPVIDPKNQGVVWEGFGTSLSWFAHRIGRTADSVRTRYADLLFDRQKGLGLNIVRYNIGGGENPAYPGHMEVRARIPGWQRAENAPYDQSVDPAQRWFLQAAKSRIPAADFIAESFSNSPPWWMTVSGSVTGGRNGVENCKPDYYDRFAKYLVDVNEFFRGQGVNFRTLSPVNEPRMSWTFGGRQEGCRWFPENQAKMVNSLYNELRRRGSRTTISGTEEYNIEHADDNINGWSEATRAQFAQYNTHTYAGRDRISLQRAARGKRIWMSEYGDNQAHGAQMSSMIMWDVKWLKSSAFCVWQAVEGGGGWGLLEAGDLNSDSTDHSKIVINKKFWRVAQWTRYVPSGARVIEVPNDDDTVAFYDSKNGKLIVITPNRDPNVSWTSEYNVSGFVTAQSKVSGVFTGPNHDLAPVSATLSNGRFTGQVPAMTTVTWVIDRVKGS